jgi:predicted rRNA methylase YqxC with S4 and FtsJ domains
MKVRIDKLLVERGLVPSRERAQAMVGGISVVFTI